LRRRWLRCCFMTGGDGKWQLEGLVDWEKGEDRMGLQNPQWRFSVLQDMYRDVRNVIKGYTHGSGGVGVWDQMKEEVNGLRRRRSGPRGQLGNGSPH
jgi:hypothetical protein